MSASQLVVVTGKGGVGKTTVAAALGVALAAEGRRVLLVELARDRGLSHLLPGADLGPQPASLRPKLDGARVEERRLLEAYFTRLLRLPLLTNRLFSSITFNAVATAAPGVTEFLILDRLLRWLEGGRLRRSRYDFVVVDGPATGHALRLLRTPRQLARMVAGGPLGGTAQRLIRLLEDPERAAVLLVSIPDEMAVNETIEARARVVDELAMRVTRPVLNQSAKRRFAAADREAVLDLCGSGGDDPVLRAARLQIGARRETERHVGRLRRAFGEPPVALPDVDAAEIDTSRLADLGRPLARLCRA